MNQGPFNPYTAPGQYGPPAGTPPGNFGGPSGYDYEFNESENAVIGKSAYWARVLGILMIVTGAGSLIQCNVVTFGIDLAVGLTFLGAATSLNMVVNTQGNDIQHMMMALGKLRTAFKIRVIVVIVALVLVLLATVFIALFFAAAHQSR